MKGNRIQKSRTTGCCFRKGMLLLLFPMLLVCSAISQEIKIVKITELESVIRQSETPLVINFWATFCKPCMEEIPYFIKLEKEFEKDSVRLLLVSLDLEDDYPGKINAFIARRKISSVVWWLNESNADYFCPRIDESWSGAIPASLFINNKKGYRRFVEEALTEELIEKEFRLISGKADE